MNQNNPPSADDWNKVINEIAQRLTENGYDAPAVLNRWFAYIRTAQASGQPFDIKESIRFALKADE